MNKPDVRQLLQSKRDEIAARWFELIVRTSFASFEAGALSQQLAALSDRLITELLAEPFSPSEGKVIGETLAGFRYLRPEALGGTVTLLAQELLAELPAQDSAALQSRLALLLGAMVTGYLGQKMTNTLAEQEAIHRALLAARQQSENALHLSETRYRAVVTQATEGIVLVDPQTARILETNHAFQTLLGYSRQELTGLPVHKIVAHERASIDRNLQRAVTEGQYTVHERRYRRKDGALVIVEGSATTLKTGNGQLLCLIVRDITERIRMEDELDEARRGLSTSL